MERSTICCFCVLLVQIVIFFLLMKNRYIVCHTNVHNSNVMPGKFICFGLCLLIIENDKIFLTFYYSTAGWRRRRRCCRQRSFILLDVFFQSFEFKYNKKWIRKVINYHSTYCDAYKWPKVKPKPLARADSHLFLCGFLVCANALSIKWPWIL